MAHQKVKYNAQLTEAEASMKQFQRTHEREVWCVYYYVHVIPRHIQSALKQWNLLGLSMSVYMQKTKLNLWVIITTVQYPFRNSNFTVVSLHHKQQKFGRTFKFGKSYLLPYPVGLFADYKYKPSRFFQLWYM